MRCPGGEGFDSHLERSSDAGAPSTDGVDKRNDNRLPEPAKTTNNRGRHMKEEKKEANVQRHNSVQFTGMSHPTDRI